MRVLSRSVAAAAALALGTGLAFLIPTSSASAATGTVTKPVERGHNVVMTNGQKTVTEDTALWGLDFADEGVLLTYCIDKDLEANPGSERKETDWSKFPAKKEKAAGIAWVLHNSYPLLSLEEFQKNMGVEVSAKDAIAGTQAMIWSTVTNKWWPKRGENPQNVLDVVSYFRSHLVAGEHLEKVNPKVSIDPSSAKGEAGEKVGPFTVNTNQKKAKVALASDDGATLVDEDGKAVKKAKDGDKLYVQTEEGSDGAATISAKVSAKQRIGRLFVNKNDQRLIVPGFEKKKDRATADATWTTPVVESPSPSPSESQTPSPSESESESPAPTTSKGDELPVTGSSTVLPLVIGGASILLLGVVLIAAARMRHRNTTA